MKIADVARKYKHIWVFLYFFIYTPWFRFLEKKVTKNFFVLHTSLDDLIPFNEYFTVPYLLWFVFMPIAFIYFFFSDVKEFYDMSKFMFIGDTLFLIICTLFPNGLALRPETFARNNIFVRTVQVIYMMDTPTNVLPSIHVFNTLCVCAAVRHSKDLQKRRVLKMVIYFASALVVLSTMFLKQHSLVDVSAAVLLAYALNRLIYHP